MFAFGSKVAIYRMIAGENRMPPGIVGGDFGARQQHSRCIPDRITVAGEHIADKQQH